MSSSHESRTPSEIHACVQQLAILQHHWGEPYEITWQKGQFVAERRDGRGTLMHRDSVILNTMIRDDYSANPVPREIMERDLP